MKIDWEFRGDQDVTDREVGWKKLERRDRDVHWEDRRDRDVHWEERLRCALVGEERSKSGLAGIREERSRRAPRGSVEG